MPKAWLPFGDETMLQRVVRLMGSVANVERIVVVAAAEQALPPLPPNVILARDEQPDRGPLQGLLAGLSALPPDVVAAFVTSCDVPLLVPEFVERMFELADGCEIAVPVEVVLDSAADGTHSVPATFPHPLSAIYRPSVLPHIWQLLASNCLRVRDLFDLVPARHIATEELCDIDPQLRSLQNLNTPADYFAAAVSAGIAIPAEVRNQLLGE